jgi:hypothetical protein
MVLRSEQGPYDCEPLRCNRDAPLTTPRDELAEPLNGVPLARPSIHQPDFSHKPLLVDQQHWARPTTSARENEITADRLNNLQIQPISALACK